MWNIYIDIYIDLESITLIYSALLHGGVVVTIRLWNLRAFVWCGAFHQVVKIYTASTNMLKSQFFLPNMISVLLYFAYVRETLLILKKFIGSCSSFFSLSGYKITPSGQGNICVQDEGMVYLPNNPMLYWKKPIT